jgi:CheY-like chemotaxis protein
MSEKKVLIIDDDPNVSEVIEGYLEDLVAIKTFASNNPNEAIELIASEEIDLVVTDIIMPEINGIDLAQHIRDKFPQVKILVFSGGGASGDIFAGVAVDTALDKGADAGILKPFSKDELLEVIVPLLKS